ncbi:hypothetical protein HWV62_30447 [Athelia sp. TMB]|nr:hypothetical protein HWV62_30447 [Athelia sp. TMB]
MTRRKNEDPNVKPGKKSWVSGTKASFLQSHNSAWVSATGRGGDAAGAFYTQVTKLWVKKYGWYFDQEKDLDEDTPNPTAESLLEPEEVVDDEEAEKRNEYFQSMRNRIRSYFYRANKTVSTVDAAKEIANILEGAAGSKPRPPRRMQLLQYYSTLYYPERIKPTVDAEWAKMRESEAEEKIKFVDFQKKVTRRFWENETQAFRDNLIATREREYQARRKAFDEHVARVTKENPHSAEAYHSRLSTAGATLSNLCEALGKQYGMNVSIFLCGPIGARDGRIEMRSVHHGVTLGLDPKKWPHAFPEDFREVQESMVAFTKRCYTLQQCKERSLADHDQALDGDAGPIALSTGPEGFAMYTLDDDDAKESGTPTPSHTPSLNQTVNPSPSPALSQSAASETVGSLPNSGFADPTPSAAAPDFDPLAVGPFVDVEPPAGFDSVRSDFFGLPENLTLLTQHLHEEQSGWETFQDLMGEHSAAASTGFGDLSLPDVAAESAPSQYALPGPVPSLLSPAKPSGAVPGAGGVLSPLESPRWPSIQPISLGGPSGLAATTPALADSHAGGASPTPMRTPSNTEPTRASDDESAVDAPSRCGGAPPSTSPPNPVASPTHTSPPPAADAPAEALPLVKVSVEFSDCPNASRALYAPLFDVADALGPEFRACVGSFLKLERAAGWTLKDPPRLPAANRPAEYNAWMQRARKSNFNAIGTEFGERLWLWWISMQPTVRMGADARPVRTSMEALDWGGLAVPGKSGIFLIVLGLYWWSLCGDGGRSEDRWREAVVDVAWVCEHIVNFGGLPAPDAAPAKPAARATANKRKLV